MSDNDNQYKELANLYLKKHGQAILKNNLIKWSDFREVARQSISLPSNIKTKLAKLGYEERQQVLEELRKLIFYDFPSKWRIYFVTGKRYATMSDLDFDFYENSTEIYNGVHAYEMVYTAKQYLISVEKTGVQIDLEVHGLNINDNFNPYLKLKKSQIQSFHYLVG